MTDRSCTCHPDDNPPVPCARKYALTECRKAAAMPDIEKMLDRAKHSAGKLYVYRFKHGEQQWREEYERDRAAIVAEYKRVVREREQFATELMKGVSFYSLLASILTKAQGVVDAETGNVVDVGYEVVQLRLQLEAARDQIKRLGGRVDSNQPNPYDPATWKDVRVTK